MNLGILLSYPTWFIALCLFSGLLYAGILYFRNNQFKSVETKFPLRATLSFFRLLLVSLLTFFLLSPLVKKSTIEEEKPIIVFAQDNSSSLHQYLKGNDSIEYFKQVNESLDKLTKKYQVDKYGFGKAFERASEYGLDQQLTNLSDVISSTSELYENQNIGALIIATDGIYNQGINPLYTSNTIYPIYTIGLGDTSIQRDLSILEIDYNSVVYLDDKFIINVKLKASNAKNEQTQLIIEEIKGKQANKQLSNSTIIINEDNFFRSKEIILDASTKGTLHLRATLKSIDGEATVDNNVQDIFIEVIGDKQEILLLANAPHPDINAYKSAIETNKNYKLEVKYADKFEGNLSSYSLVIFYQLPSIRNKIAAIKSKLLEMKIPALYITGSQNAYPLLNSMQNLIEFKVQNSLNEVNAIINDEFNSFTIDDGETNIINGLPPLFSPYGQFKVSVKANVIAFQKIGNVKTDYPLIVVGESNNQKTGIILAEGYWRWRVYDYLTNKNQITTNSLVNKVVQYLTIKEDKRPFKATMVKEKLYENDLVELNIELYNDNYELVNSPNVDLTVFDEDDKEYPFSPIKKENKYYLNAGYFPVGSYSFRAKTIFNGTEYKSEGRFIVQQLKLENINLRADHQLLKNISQKSGGAFYSQNNVNELADQINSKNIVATLHESISTTPLINVAWIFWLLIGLLSIEWFLRKWFGGY